MRPTKLAIACLLCAAFLPLPRAAFAVDPWKALEAMRASLLADGATEADFTQTYRPAGFDTAEREEGRIILRLPDCLRWDYTTPYPKSFLLCDGQVHSWNEEDEAGQIYRVNPEREPGLDLLLLPTEDLRFRYRADAQDLEGMEVAIVLTPAGETSQIRKARLVVDTRARRLTTLEYEDADGGTTRFEISGYRPLQGEAPFTPPSNVEWSEQRAP